MNNVIFKLIKLGIRYEIGKRISNANIFLNDIINKLIFLRYKKKIIEIIENNEYKPERVYFGVTNICNARCVFCNYKNLIKEKSNYKVGIMSMDIYKTALEQISKLGVHKISFTPTIGETLINRNLPNMIKLAKKKNFYVYFYTNGILLNDYYIDIINSGVDEIHISTAGFEKKKWEVVHGVNKYNNFIDGLSKMLEYIHNAKKKIKVVIELRTNDNPIKIYFQRDFKNKICKYADNIDFNIISTYDNWGGRISKNDLLEGMVLRREYKFKRIPCHRLFNFAILYDGSVRLCACRVVDSEFDDLVVGNVMKEDITSIYYSDKTKSIIKNFLNGDYPITCQNCSLYTPMKLNKNY